MEKRMFVGAVTAWARLATVSQHDSTELPVEIIIVIVPTRNPLHARLLFDRSEETRIPALASNRLLSVAIVLLLIVHVKVLVQWDMHEKHSFSFRRVIVSNLLVFLPEPLDRVWTNTVEPNNPLASCAPRVHEPQPRSDFVTALVREDRDNVILIDGSH